MISTSRRSGWLKRARDSTRRSGAALRPRGRRGRPLAGGRARSLGLPPPGDRRDTRPAPPPGGTRPGGAAPIAARSCERTPLRTRRTGPTRNTRIRRPRAATCPCAPHDGRGSAAGRYWGPLQSPRLHGGRLAVYGVREPLPGLLEGLLRLAHQVIRLVLDLPAEMPAGIAPAGGRAETPAMYPTVAPASAAPSVVTIRPVRVMEPSANDAHLPCVPPRSRCRPWSLPGPASPQPRRRSPGGSRGSGRPLP